MHDDQTYSLQEALERSTEHGARYWVSKEPGKKLLYVVSQGEHIVWLAEGWTNGKDMTGRPFSAYTALLRRHGVRIKTGWQPVEKSATHLKERKFVNDLLSDIDLDLY